MAEDWCERCDLPASQCEHSLPKEQRDLFGARRRVPGDLVADGPTITAWQRTPCAGCGAMIEPEDTITHTSEGWAHASEVSPAEGPSPTEPELFDGI